MAQARAAATNEPGIASAIMPLDRGLVIVAVSTFMPDNRGETPLTLAGHPVLVLARPFDQALTNALAETFLLTDLHLADAEAATSAATLALGSSQGRPVSRLIWQAPTPGKALLNRLAPAAVGGLLADPAVRSPFAQ